eukprot:TRINITY_DN5483_c1_g1_i1.p1 TRINITY_DN5483_c1_g1~~TRINITY_DN5483_c1_g1_i1.p1  ORF type:complete len:383 (+),score=94.64 TRINITY_DN5483_c1_g1_i1:48-1151(+)
MAVAADDDVREDEPDGVWLESSKASEREVLLDLRQPQGRRRPACSTTHIGNCRLMCGLFVPPGGIFRSFSVVVLIAGPTVAFCLLTQHVLWLWVPAAATALLDVVSIAATTFTDPGVVPRRPPRERPFSEPPERRVELPGWMLITLYPGDRVCRVGDGTALRRWCRVCNLLRPPRGSHCRQCDNCVDGFDHHCYVLGACIGLRNYRFFFSFLFFTALLSVWIGGWCILGIASSSTWHKVVGEDVDTIGRLPAAILSVVCVIACFLTGSLVFVYSNLACTNRTQRDMMKAADLYPHGESPFPRGPAPLLCASRMRSLIRMSDSFSDPWEKRYPEDRRVPIASVEPPAPPTIIAVSPPAQSAPEPRDDW